LKIHGFRYVSLCVTLPAEKYKEFTVTISDSQYLHSSHALGPMQYNQFHQSVCAVECQDTGASALGKGDWSCLLIHILGFLLPQKSSRNKEVAMKYLSGIRSRQNQDLRHAGPQLIYGL